MDALPDRVAATIRCAAMTRETREAAFALLGAFLGRDAHYQASAAVYGDSGAAALDAALTLFLARPELGFVWLARAEREDGVIPVGCCVVCLAISTSRGSLVAKLDDVTIANGWQGRGVGTAMLGALVRHVRAIGVTRIDTACHRDNAGAWRFYERLGFRPLDEERIACLL